MEKYMKPAIVECGNSESVIKGDCGWGGENWTLDKTGAYWTTRRKYVHAGWLPGYIEVYKCQSTKACSTESHQC
jgi:hypothetical protein